MGKSEKKKMVACRECVFWLTGGNGKGDCRRRSPEIGIQGMGAWPRTEAGDRCGEGVQEND